MSNRFSFLVFSCLATILVLLWHGYQFGRNDQVETLPYVLKLANPQLYPSDFFLENLSFKIPNERWAFAMFLKPFIRVLPLAVLFLHIFFLWLLLAGLFKITYAILRKQTLAWLVVLASMLPGYMITLGDVDVYYNTFQGGNIALAFATWALYFAVFRKHWLAASLLFALATPFQILVALNFFIWLGLYLLYQTVIQKVDLKVLLGYGFLYLLTGGLYFIAVVVQKEMNTCGIDSKTYFDVIFDFRNTHHFLIETFPFKRTLVFVTMFLIGLWIAGRGYRTVFVLLAIAALLLCIYIPVTSFLRIANVASFQFFILTGHLKLLAFALIVYGVLKTVNVFVNPGSKMVLTVVLMLFITAGILRATYQPFDISSKQLKQNPEIDICIAAKSLTPADALCLQPFSFSAYKYYSQRSSYVEFKASLHQRCGITEWMRRLAVVYGISPAIKEKGFHLQNIADTHYNSLSTEKWEQLKSEGITHFIYPNAFKPETACELLYKNSEYVLYRLL